MIEEFFLYAVITAALLLAFWYYLETLQVGNLCEKPILITGCDCGFGYMLTLKLLRSGVPVFAGCLTDKGQAELRKDAQGLPGTLETFSLDVTKQESVDNALRFVEGKLGSRGLWGLVNNAGILGNCAFDDWLKVEDYTKALDVNVVGAIRVTQTFKKFVKKAKGRIVACASVSGRFAGPMTGPYAVSKYALEAYCDVLRFEMPAYKVSTHILEPGFFATNLLDPNSATKNLDYLWQRAPSEIRAEYGEMFFEKVKEVSYDMLSKLPSTRTHLVIDAYCHALLSRFPRRRYHVGLDSQFVWIPLSMMPTIVQDMVIQLKNRQFIVGKYIPEVLKTKQD